jgi:uncharacterized protein YceK
MAYSSCHQYPAQGHTMLTNYLIKKNWCKRVLLMDLPFEAAIAPTMQKQYSSSTKSA